MFVALRTFYFNLLCLWSFSRSPLFHCFSFSFSVRPKWKANKRINWKKISLRVEHAFASTSQTHWIHGIDDRVWLRGEKRARATHSVRLKRSTEIKCEDLKEIAVSDWFVIEIQRAAYQHIDVDQRESTAMCVWLYHSSLVHSHVFFFLFVLINLITLFAVLLSRSHYSVVWCRFP